MRERPDLKTISDDKLLRGLFEVLKQTRHDEADFVAHIAEVDARKLYARQAAPSMFARCTEVLHLSEAEVTEKNRDVLLKRAVHKSKRQIEQLLAELAPRPASPTTMRKLPIGRSSHATGGLVPHSELRPAGVVAPGSGTNGAVHSDAELRPAGVVTRLIPEPKATRTPKAVAPARFRLQFDLDAEFRDDLERLQALVRTSVPDGDLGKVIRLAVTRELARLEARRFAKTKKPGKRLAQTDTRPKSRHIPAAVRRFVEKRDAGRCTCKDKHERRCTKRHDLEFHHRMPFGLGGDHSPDGIGLMCRTHNQLLAEQDYGEKKMARHRRRASRDTRIVDVVGAGSGESGLRAQWRSTG
jgi:hypothetical protein